MPAYVPVPEGLQVPEEPTFVLPVTFEMRDGQLYALEVDGLPLPEAGNEMEGEAPEQPEMSEEDFMSAVERQMGGAPKR